MQKNNWIMLIRNSIQWVLIKLIKLTKPFWRSKIFLFSMFMACKDREYLLTQKGIEHYVVITSDIGVSRKIYIGAQDEYLKVCKALKIISHVKGRPQKAIDLLIDIGTNLGHISIPMLKRNLVTKAIGFEPDPNNFRICSANILINNLSDRITLHNTAIGSKDGESLVFELSEDNSGDHRIRVIETDGVYSEATRKLVTVTSNTLDSYFTHSISPDHTLIWIDTQGYEGYVLEGAQKLLAQKIPTVFEFWPYGFARTKTFPRLMNALKDFDYFYDLSDPNPSPQSISKLHNLYERHLDTTSFTEILIF